MEGAVGVAAGASPPLQQGTAATTLPNEDSNGHRSHASRRSGAGASDGPSGGARVPASQAKRVGPPPQHTQPQQGISSSQSSGGGSGPRSRASSSSSTTAAAATAAVAASTTETTGDDPSSSSARAHGTESMAGGDSRRATPATTPPVGCSPSLGPATSIRPVVDRSSRSSRKHKGGGSSSGGGGNRHDRTHSGGASAEDARYTRTAFDRCKVARAIAAQWMSRLMRSPPEQATIESVRATVRRGKASSTEESSASTAPSQVPPPSPPLDQSSTLAKQKPAVNSISGAGHGNTFLEAVLSAKANTAATATATTPPVPSSSSTADSTPAGASEHERAPSLTNSAGTASNSINGHTHYESLELVPDNLDNVPSLLHALREIALSCASLDTLGKASSVGAGTAASSAGEDGGGGRRKSKSAGVVVTPSSPAAVGSSTAPPPLPHTAIAADESVLVTRSRELHGEYEAQWNLVCSHFATVRGLVLNDHELAEALDAAFGEDWRTEEEVAGNTKDGEASSSTTTTTAMSSRRTSNEEDRSKTVATVAASSPLRRSAKEYVPRDFYPPPTASAASPVAPTTPTHAAALAASSTLNSNAEPFRTRFASTGGGGSGGSSGVLDGTATAPTPLTHHADPSSSSSVHAAALGNGGERLSSGTPAYSPSQAVALFLERVSPPPLNRPESAGKATFPSTPPTREAAVMGSSGAAKEENSAASSSCDDSARSSPRFSPASAATTGDIGGGGSTAMPLRHAHQEQPTGGLTTANSAASSPAFRLESREDMLRRRNAAPSSFYASTAHYYGGSSHSNNNATSGNGNAIHSTVTTPPSFHPASSPNGGKHGGGGGVGFMTAGGAGGLIPHGPRSMPVSPIMSYSTPVVAAQCPFDYILVIDFEATCEEHPPLGYLYEIIEFPVVLVDVRLQRAVAEFHRFVRPRFKTQLSDFCKALTGIEQADVDEALPLEEVILQFERWYHQTVPPNARAVFATDGPMDFKEFMHNHSVLRQNIRFPSLFYQWIDVKQVFANFFQCQQGKIKVMLEVLHCPFEGRLHSGIDDARNIARIVIGLLQWGCTFCDVPLSRIPVPSTASPMVAHRSPGNANAAGLVRGSSVSSVTSMSSSIPFGSPLHLPPSTASGHPPYTRSSGAE